MKNTLIFIFLIFTSFNSQANNIAIDAVKSNPKVINFLADKSPDKYRIAFQQVELGGVCGFTGCNWRKLVSLVVTSKSSNSPTSTVLLLVEGISSPSASEPTVSFITIKKQLDNNLVLID